MGGIEPLTAGLQGEYWRVNSVFKGKSHIQYLTQAQIFP